MFKPKTLKILSIIAIIICIICTFLSTIIALMNGGLSFLAILSWILLAYASYCAMKLTGYDIYEEDLRNIGWSIYILFVVFILFILIGLSVGPIVAIVITARLHFQKKTIEEWMQNNG